MRQFKALNEGYAILVVLSCPKGQDVSDGKFPQPPSTELIWCIIRGYQKVISRSQHPYTLNIDLDINHAFTQHLFLSVNYSITDNTVRNMHVLSFLKWLSTLCLFGCQLSPCNSSTMSTAVVAGDPSLYSLMLVSKSQVTRQSLSALAHQFWPCKLLV